MQLHRWVRAYTGVSVAHRKVCRHHQPPFDGFAHQVLARPSIALWLGPRGGGKSFLSGLDSHLASRFNPRAGTRILGGSLAQSQQIYDALKKLVLDGSGPLGSDGDAIALLLSKAAHYRNGSKVEILACSAKSVRGPHIPSLKLDEVDEIDDSLRQDSLGMCMADAGLSASILMTSTWHRVGGPMAALIDAAEGGDFPLYRFCIFEVMERCPESRSGPWVGGDAGYAHCPECPLKPWCHAERSANGDAPLAKLADGHYAIDSAIQKVQAASLRVFEADYLCTGPKADGLWFTGFDDRNVSVDAEYDPALPVHLAVDSGVYAGAVWFQIADHGDPGRASVNVFGDYLGENRGAEGSARDIIEIGRTLCNGRQDRGTTDPAGTSRNAVGPTVMAEYLRVGLRLEPWPKPPIADGLALVESFVRSANGVVGLKVHPRCRLTIDAFRSYRRALRAGQWMDFPKDPQHPHEELLDSLRGGLNAAFPYGRRIVAPTNVVRRIVNPNAHYRG